MTEANETPTLARPTAPFHPCFGQRIATYARLLALRLAAQTHLPTLAPYLYAGTTVREHPLAHMFNPLVWARSKLFPPLQPDDGKNPKRITFAPVYHGKVIGQEDAYGHELTRAPRR